MLTESFKSITNSLIANLKQLGEEQHHIFVADWIDLQGFEPESLDELICQHHEGRISMNEEQLHTANELVKLF